MEEIEIDGGANRSRLRNGHGSKCMCGKGLKLKLGPENLKKLRKGGARIIKLSEAEREANGGNIDLHKGGRRQKNVVQRHHDEMRRYKPEEKFDLSEAYNKGLDPRARLHYLENLRADKRGSPAGGAVMRRDPKPYTPPPGTMSLKEMREDFKKNPAKYTTGIADKRGGSLSKFAKAITHAVDKADSELKDLGAGARRKMGFTKKKFRDVIKETMGGMGMEDREGMARDMEGGKFSLYRNDWGLGATGKRLNESFKKHFKHGMDTADRKIEHELDEADKKEGFGLVYGQGQGKKKKKGGPLSQTDREQRAARREARKSAPAAPAAPAKKAAPKKAPRVLPGPSEMPNDGPPEILKDPLAWSTKGVPNKCGSTERGQKVLRADSARELASKAASYLTKCPKNPERIEKRSAAIEKYNEKIRGNGLVYGNGLTYGQPGMRGGSIGARLAAPTNIGAGGNLLAPSNPAMRSQAGASRWSMFKQMPVNYQPKGMFTTMY